jgi:negative regulator of flagellin synthesis FlgM
MTNTIPGENQRAAGVMAQQAVDPNNKQKSESPESIAPSTVKSQDSSVELSAKLKNDISTVNFDTKKVDQIKQSIEQGNYPLDNRKMAESFIPLEKLLS